MKRKSWTKRAPKLVSERRELKKRCGAKAFLDANKLKYPVVAKVGGCKVNCAGVEAAFKRSRQFNHPKIAKKAIKLAVRAKCSWAI